jgi:poly-gamma-glutamate synthesis protein (capsule biosynthesis protein)
MARPERAVKMRRVLGWCLGLQVLGAWAGPAGAPPVSIAFVGDIMLDEAPGRAIARADDPFKHFAGLLAATDIRVGNLECVVATKGRPEPNKPFTFRAHPLVLKTLARHFDVLSLANNHSGDYGPDAFVEMMGLLRRQGIGYFGGGLDLQQAHAPALIERRGLRIALLGYNEFFPKSFEADFDKPGVAWSEDDQVRFDIRQARARHGADLVIPVMHWGWEHEPRASARQRRLARLMVDAGADAVVGGHPHVTQDIEFYKGKPIVYSLGNFVFNGFNDEDNNTGWLLRLSLDRQGVTGFEITVARIDGASGIPRPLPPDRGWCWSRGKAAVQSCVPRQDGPGRLQAGSPLKSVPVP